MNLHEVLTQPKGRKFLYKGKEAEVVWTDTVRYLIMKGNTKTNPPEPDIYFRSDAIYFSVEGLKEGITLVSCFPAPKIIEEPDYQQIQNN